jgi:hypothetical protein
MSVPRTLLGSSLGLSSFLTWAGTSAGAEIPWLKVKCQERPPLNHVKMPMKRRRMPRRGIRRHGTSGRITPDRR